MVDELVACAQQAAVFGDIREYQGEEAILAAYSINAFMQHLANIVQVSHRVIAFLFEYILSTSLKLFLSDCKGSDMGKSVIRCSFYAVNEHRDCATINHYNLNNAAGRNM